MKRLLIVFFFKGDDHHRDLHSSPPRRSSDRVAAEERLEPVFLTEGTADVVVAEAQVEREPLADLPVVLQPAGCQDRKSTRLNSSHANISYAVFCLKKKKASTTRSPSSATSTR